MDGDATANDGPTAGRWWGPTAAAASSASTDVMNQLCRVCGEPAAGFHFGAFTCEGCKSFFGRTYNNISSISECKNNGECVINKKNRTSCKACRLRKCLLVGMSKSGSRYGRRSNWFKIHCLLQEQNNAPNNENNNNMFPGAQFFAGGLYPGAFLQNQLLSSPNLLLPHTHHNEKQKSKKRKMDDGRHSSASFDEAGSSAGDLEDESSRSVSALSFRRSSSAFQPPSPFNEQDFLNQRKLSATAPLPRSPMGGTNTQSPFSSSSPFFNNYPLPSPPAHLLLPRLGLYPPVSEAGFSVTRPGLTPVHTNHYNLFCGPSGGDLALYSPSVGGVAVEQDEPIDLSVKPTSLPCQSPASPLKSKTAETDSKSHFDDDDPSIEGKSTAKRSSTPLNLTSKKPREVL